MYESDGHHVGPLETLIFQLKPFTLTRQSIRRSAYVKRAPDSMGRFQVLRTKMSCHAG
jgi:hypothetical protein